MAYPYSDAVPPDWIFRQAEKRELPFERIIAERGTATLFERVIAEHEEPKPTIRRRKRYF